MYRYRQSFGYLYCDEFEVVAITPKGKRIKPIKFSNCFDNRERFVINEAKKRFAYESKEKALENFIKRTEWHIILAKNNIRSAEVALLKAKILEIKEETNENQF